MKEIIRVEARLVIQLVLKLLLARRASVPVTSLLRVSLRRRLKCLITALFHVLEELAEVLLVLFVHEDGLGVPFLVEAIVQLVEQLRTQTRTAVPAASKNRLAQDVAAVHTCWLLICRYEHFEHIEDARVQ